MPPLAYSIVDAFTSSPFSGNPAAVIMFPTSFPSSKASDPNFLLQVAKEFNLSETAFLIKEEKKEGDPEGSDAERYGLRWFTPAVEIVLCGHATLASAHILFSQYPHLTHVSFSTLSGTLTAVRRSTASGTPSIELNFPSDTVVLQPVSEEDVEIVKKGLGVCTNEVCGPEQVRGVGKTKSLGWVVEVDGEVDLKGLKVDITAITKELGGLVTLTQASSDPAYDIVSRCFAPKFGIDEDPVTGGAHCTLTPYYLGVPSARSRLRSPSFQKETFMTLTAKQVSARGGEMECVWDKEGARATLVGKAVEVMKGEILGV